jgi:hypothetical protein
VYFATPSEQKVRLLVRQEATWRRFLSIKLGMRGDGSLYVSFDRKWADNELHSWSVGQQQSITKTQAQSKEVRLSYHPTGMLNPHGLSGGATYNDPLFAVSRPVHLITVSIPSVDRLDLFEGDVGPNDAALELPNGRRLDFEVFVAPAEPSSLPGTIFQVSWTGLMSVVVTQVVLPTELIPPQEQNHFIFLRRTSGDHDEQVVRRDEAFIRFHQRITGHPDLLIYGPNGEGTYLMVFSVPMRVMPLATILPHAPDCVAHILNASNHFLRYQIRRANGQLVKEPVQVSATLDARL